jgi:hypothetical protein
MTRLKSVRGTSLDAKGSGESSASRSTSLWHVSPTILWSSSGRIAKLGERSLRNFRTRSISVSRERKSSSWRSMAGSIRLTGESGRESGCIRSRANVRVQQRTSASLDSQVGRPAEPGGLGRASEPGRRPGRSPGVDAGLVAWARSVPVARIAVRDRRGCCRRPSLRLGLINLSTGEVVEEAVS